MNYIRTEEIFRGFARRKKGGVRKMGNQDVCDRLQINKELTQPGCGAQVSA
jgi:hypothetical protein